MNQSLRVLTVDMKPSVNDALAARDDLEIIAMEQGVAEPTARGAVTLLPYERRAKVSPKAAAGVRQAVRDFEPDLVQTHGSRPLAHTVLGLMGQRGRPPIVAFRGVTSAPSRLRAEDWMTYLSPLVSAYLCESQASLDGLAAGGVPRQRCHVVYNCLTREPNRALDRSCLDEFDIPRDAFLVACVANFRRVKGGDLLIEAAERLLDLPDTHFLIVGKVRDTRMRRLLSNPRLAGRVHATGYRTDGMDLASLADLFVMPSRAEALCVALLEAMSLGVCPVVSDAGGMKEAVRNGVDGAVFPRENPAALAALLRELHADRSRIARYSASVAARFRQSFSGEALGARYAEAYRTIVAEQERSRLIRSA